MQRAPISRNASSSKVQLSASTSNLSTSATNSVDGSTFSSSTFRSQIQRLISNASFIPDFKAASTSGAFAASREERLRVTNARHNFVQTSFKRYHLENSKLMSCSFCDEILWDMDSSVSAKDGFLFYKCAACGISVHWRCANLVPCTCREATTLLLWTHENSETDSPNQFSAISAPDDLTQIWFSSIERFAYGANEFGGGRELQLLDPTFTAKVSSVPAPLTHRRIKMVAAGAAHTLFLTETGQIYSMGKNFAGQLGSELIEANVTTDSPMQILRIQSFVKKIACGGNHSLAITANNEIFSWGDGRNGRIGHGDEENQFVPKSVDANELLAQLQIETGELEVFEDKSDSPRKRSILPAERYYPLQQYELDIGCGWSHSIAIVSSGDRTFLYTFGRGTSGQCGHGEIRDELKPRLVKALLDKKIISASGGYFHTACLTEEGEVLTFGGGEGQSGQGQNNLECQAHPIKVELPEPAANIVCSSFHTIAVTRETSSLYVWGRMGATVYHNPTQIELPDGAKLLNLASSSFQTAILVNRAETRKSRDASIIRRQANLTILEVSKKGAALSASHYEVLRLAFTAKLQRYYTETNLQLQEQIDEQVESYHPCMLKEEQRNVHRLRRDHLAAQLESGTAAMKNDGIYLDELFKKNQASSKVVEEVFSHLDKKQLELAQAKLELEKNKLELRKQQFLIMRQRARLITELKRLFPIESTKPNEFTICGILLPNIDNFAHSRESPFTKDPYPRYDKEQIAASLGAVSHLICMMARYFEFPLTYKVIPMGSKSLIVDKINYQPGQPFPLFASGQKVENFVSALFLLHKNIEQLAVCACQLLSNGKLLEITHFGHTLPNLIRILEAFNVVDKVDL
eukprot:TRINITY_DN4546_c0_g2_i1.p1 TRINITY_DN4546_c0_g2~~TRINITY_DN4546_c0_g2_i1.p1  ORF type:complete len:863 (-),score=199.03 TRINITY_DN4546_c0_g2_i1:53-2641(-)